MYKKKTKQTRGSVAGDAGLVPLTAEQRNEQARIAAELGLPLVTDASLRRMSAEIDADWLRGNRFAARPATQIVERWTGSAWIEVRLVWDGTQYAEVA